VTADDAGFTAWYQKHVKRFFGVSGPDYDTLFALHTLEHKKCGDPGPTYFDGLCCDGSANYVKLLRADEGENWKPAGELKGSFKARSFGNEAKAALAEWVIRAYTTDDYDGPPPITESTTLLAFKEAGQVARNALKLIEDERAARWLEGPPDPAVVYYP